MADDIQLLILGCGFSLGVPVVGCSCVVCSSRKSRNIRTRSSILLTLNGKKLLVDFGADLRQQCLQHNITNIDAALLTHMHADHVGGIDDLRVFPFFSKRSLPLFADREAMIQLKKSYDYLFIKESIELKDLADLNSIFDVPITPFMQKHGNIQSIGLKVGQVVYCNDVSEFDAAGEEILAKTAYWVLDCMSSEATYAHIGLRQILDLAAKYNPTMVYLTNMGHNLDYYELTHILPANICPAYDGMKLSF